MSDALPASAYNWFTNHDNTPQTDAQARIFTVLDRWFAGNGSPVPLSSIVAAFGSYEAFLSAAGPAAQYYAGHILTDQ